MLPQRVPVLVVITALGLLTLGCWESPTSPAGFDGTLEVLPAKLVSGGEGVLVSDAFNNLQLVEARDSLAEPIPRRWTNLQVTLDGTEVDSWQIDDRSVGFRVPPSESGTHEVAVRLSGVPSPSASVSVVGLVPDYRPKWSCAFGVYPGGTHFLVVAPAEVVAVVDHCVWAGREWEGVARLTLGDAYGDVPLLPFQHSKRFDDPWEEPVDWRDEWIDELWYDNDVADHSVQRAMWAVGASFRQGHAVAERYPALGADSSSTWVWRFGRNPEPVTALNCLPSDYGWGGGTWYGFTAAELAPGVCLAVTRDGDVLLGGTKRLGTIPVNPLRQDPSIEVASNGTAAFRRADLSEADQAWPVYGPSGELYAIHDYNWVESVIFSPGGDSMYVSAMPTDSDQWVLDLRASGDGSLLKRLPLESHIRLTLAISPEALWLGRAVTVDGKRQLRVEMRDRANLSLRRSVALPCEPRWDNPCDAIVFFPEDTPRFGGSYSLVPDGTGRRVYLIALNWSHSPIRAYAVDMS